jgi:hypothetical protein
MAVPVLYYLLERTPHQAAISEHLETIYEGDLRVA